MADLHVGDRVGPYEVLESPRTGGMGKVYPGRDTRLNRRVAIKVLHTELSGDAVSRQRFEREAQRIAQLAHPHICTLHDVGEHQGETFLVLEFLEGQTLATRIASARQGLAIGDALTFGAQVAEALSVAHHRQIIHRDIKPGNIMLTATGAKLLDFGLARLRDRDEAEDGRDIADTLTAKHQVMGTLGYMAPEQFDGRADQRSDIFAFGAVLFEMLTGRRAFEGDTLSTVMAAIVGHEPPSVSTLRPEVPPAVVRSVRRCLAKNPDARWQSAADLADELRWLADEEKRSKPPTSRPVLRGRWLAGAAVVFVAAISGTAFVARTFMSPRTPDVLTQLSLPLPQGTNFPNFGAGVALSPDGSMVAFVAGTGTGNLPTRRLYVKRLDTLDVQIVAGSENATYPFFSPDGTTIGFFANGKLLRWTAQTGSVSTIAESGDFIQGAAAHWETDGSILVGEHNDRPPVGIRRISVSNGSFEILTRPDNTRGEQSHFGPQPVRGTDTILYTVRSTGERGIEFRVVAYDRSGQLPRTVIPGASLAVLPKNDQVIYQIGNELQIASFNPTTLAVTRPRRLLAGVAGTFSGAAWAIAGDRLVYQPLTGGNRRLVWVDRQGNAAPLATPPGNYQGPVISPAGDLAALNTQDGAKGDFWIADLAHETLRPLTSDGLSIGAGVWTRDGVEYIAPRKNGIALDVVAFRTDADGASRTVHRTGEQLWTAALTPDQRSMVLMKDGDLWLIDMAGTQAMRPLVHTPAAEWGGRLSPDGRWLAYFSNATGRHELSVARFPEGSPRWQVSRNGAREAVWSRDGRELFYRNGDEMLVVGVKAVKDGEPFAWEPARMLFKGPYLQFGGPGYVHYDVSADGQRFLMIDEASPQPPVLNVIQGWPLLLR